MRFGLLVAVFASLAPGAADGSPLGTTTATVGPSTPLRTAPRPRLLGVLGESCRAALDCRPELRCKANVCVARPEPKPDGGPDPAESNRPDPSRPSSNRPSRLRLGLELVGGLGRLTVQQQDVLERQADVRSDRAAFSAAALAVLELGLDDDQITIGIGAGVASPAGFEDGRDPTLQLDLRAAWRLWRGSPSVGLYLEPRVEGFLLGLPGDFGIGGALAARLRMHWLDLGLKLGGLSSGRGPRKVSDITGVQEQLTVLHAGVFIGLMPRLAEW